MSSVQAVIINNSMIEILNMFLIFFIIIIF
jgi:hypothetical protein